MTKDGTEYGGWYLGYSLISQPCWCTKPKNPTKIQVHVASLDAQAFRPLTERWYVDRFPTMKLVKGWEDLGEMKGGFDQFCLYGDG